MILPKLGHVNPHELRARLASAHCPGHPEDLNLYLFLDAHVVIGDLSASYDSQGSTCIRIPGLRTLQVALGYDCTFPLA